MGAFRDGVGTRSCYRSRCSSDPYRNRLSRDISHSVLAGPAIESAVKYLSFFVRLGAASSSVGRREVTPVAVCCGKGCLLIWTS